MGFDAGSITAHMELTRRGWREALEEVRQEGRDLEESEIRVPVTMETRGFVPDAEEVQAIKDELGGEVVVPVKIEDPSRTAAEAIAEIEAVRAAAEEPIDQHVGIGSLGTDLRSAAADLNNAFEEIATTADRAGGRGLVQSLLDAGIGESELLTALRGFGYARSEAQAMIGQAAQAAEQAAFEAAALRDQIVQRYVEGIFAALGRMPLELGQGTHGLVPMLASIDPFIAALGAEPNWNRPLAELPSWSRGLPLFSAPWDFGTPGPSIGSYSWLRDWFGGGTFIELPRGAVRTEATSTGAGIRSLLASIGGRTGNVWSSLFSGIFTADQRDVLRMGVGGLSDHLMSEAELAGRMMVRGVADYMAQGIYDAVARDTGSVTKVWTKVATTVSGWFSSAISGLTSVADRVSAFGPGFINPFTLALSPTLIPILGAVGAAGGGALAGTAIGLGGLLAALVPGGLALQKGYAAYQAQTALAKTATTATAKHTLTGATSGTLGIATAIGRLVGTGSSVLGGIETRIAPSIVRFLSALGIAAKAAEPFINTAVTVLTRFFGVVDKGLQSQGFQSFVHTMTVDLAPIMTDFGTVVLHLGSSVGHFLDLFGGKPAKLVGGWFVRVTTDLTKFLSKLHFGPGFLTGITTAFHGIGSVLGTFAAALGLLAKGAAPVGLNILKELPSIFNPITTAIKHLPKWAVTVVTGLVVAFSGFLGFAGITKLITGIGGALAGLVASNPALLVLAGALTAVAFALNGLHSARLPATQIASAIHAANTPANYRTPEQKALLTTAAKANVGEATLRWLGQQHADHFTITHPTRQLHTRATQIVNKLNNNSTFLGRLTQTNGLDQAVGHTVNAFVRAWDAIDNNFIHPIVHGFTTVIPSAFGHVGGAFETAWHVVESGATIIWHRIDSGLVSPIVNFFGSTIPHVFAAVPGFFQSAWNHVETLAVGVWHWLYGNVFHPIAAFFTTTLPHAVEGVPSAFASVFGAVLHVIQSVWGSIKAIFTTIIRGVHDVTSAVASVGHLIGIGNPATTHAGAGHTTLGRALGGPVGAGSIHLVGETGPELVQFGASGFVTPNSVLRSIGSTVNIQIVVDARGASNPAAVRQAATNGIGATIPKLRAALERGAA